MSLRHPGWGYFLPGAPVGGSGGEPGRRPEWERSLYSWGGTGEDTTEKKKKSGKAEGGHKGNKVIGQT